MAGPEFRGVTVSKNDDGAGVRRARQRGGGTQPDAVDASDAGGTMLPDEGRWLRFGHGRRRGSSRRGALVRKQNDHCWRLCAPLASGSCRHAAVSDAPLGPLLFTMTSERARWAPWLMTLACLTACGGKAVLPSTPIGDELDARAAAGDATVSADAGDASEHAFETSGTMSTTIASSAAEAATGDASDGSTEDASGGSTEGAAEGPSADATESAPEIAAEGAAETSVVVDGTLGGLDANLEPETPSPIQDATASGADSGTSPGRDASDTCLLSVQVINYAGCFSCANCWNLHCCKVTDDCANDPTCNGYMACQANCYNGQLPDGASFDIDASGGPDGGSAADVCLQSCLPPDAGVLWNAFVNCAWPTCTFPCLCS
jgi:hypothetical protein